MRTIWWCPTARRPARLGPRRGVTLVELVTAAALAAFAALLAVETVRGAALGHAVDEAVYEAARLAASPGGTTDEARSAAARLLRAAGVRAAIIQIGSDQDVAGADLVTVRISVPLQANALLAPPLASNDTLHRQLTLPLRDR